LKKKYSENDYKELYQLFFPIAHGDSALILMKLIDYATKEKAREFA